MSWTAYATPLSLDVQPSKILFWVLTLTHAGAAAALSALSLPGWTTACLAAAVLASYLWLTARHALLWHPRSVRRLRWGSGQRWQVGLRDGRELSATLRMDSFVRPWLTVLLLRPESGGPVRNVVLLPDMLEAEAFRRLRVRLRLEQGAKTTDGSEASR